MEHWPESLNASTCTQFYAVSMNIRQHHVCTIHLLAYHGIEALGPCYDIYIKLPT